MVILAPGCLSNSDGDTQVTGETQDESGSTEADAESSQSDESGADASDVSDTDVTDTDPTDTDSTDSDDASMTDDAEDGSTDGPGGDGVPPLVVAAAPNDSEEGVFADVVKL